MGHPAPDAAVDVRRRELIFPAREDGSAGEQGRPQFEAEVRPRRLGGADGDRGRTQRNAAARRDQCAGRPLRRFRRKKRLTQPDCARRGGLRRRVARRSRRPAGRGSPLRPAGSPPAGAASRQSLSQAVPEIAVSLASQGGPDSPTPPSCFLPLRRSRKSGQHENVSILPENHEKRHNSSDRTDAWAPPARRTQKYRNRRFLLGSSPRDLPAKTGPVGVPAAKPHQSSPASPERPNGVIRLPRDSPRWHKPATRDDNSLESAINPAKQHLHIPVRRTMSPNSRTNET